MKHRYREAAAKSCANLNDIYSIKQMKYSFLDLFSAEICRETHTFTPADVTGLLNQQNMKQKSKIKEHTVGAVRSFLGQRRYRKHTKHNYLWFPLHVCMQAGIQMML